MDSLGEETWSFLGKKIRSFYPELLISLILGFCWCELRWRDTTIPALAKRLLRLIWEPMLMPMAGFHDNLVNGVDWYLSAMLLVMLVLYPICRKYPSVSVHILMPILGILIYGYIYRTDGRVGGVYQIRGIAYKGLLRAVGAISIGGTCYPIVERLKKIAPSKKGKVSFGLAEVVAWFGVFAYMCKCSRERYEIIAVLLLMFGFCLTAANIGDLEKGMPEKLCYFLGKCSLPLYLSHTYVGYGIKALQLDLTYSYHRLLCLYFLISFINAVIIYFGGRYLRKKLHW